MQLSKRGSVWVLDCKPWEADAARQHYYTYNKLVKGKWATKDPISAVRMIDYADKDTRSDLVSIRGSLNQSVANSHSTEGPQFEAPPSLSYMPFQCGGIDYTVSHPLNRNGILIADEMGLGKTVQAIGAINEQQPRDVLIVCPASLINNWKNELDKWLLQSYNVEKGCHKRGLNLTTRTINIINYEKITPLQAQLASHNFGMCIIDESGYIKNPKSKRGSHFRSLRKKPQTVNADMRIALTGTPVPNRVNELHNVVNWLQPGSFGSIREFENRYCEVNESSFGRQITGGKNLKDLQQRLRAMVMVRRLKADVLTDLPPKRRQVIELPHSGESVVEEEIELWRKHEELNAKIKEMYERTEESVECTDVHRRRIAKLRDEAKVSFYEMAKVRVKVAKIKLPLALELHKQAVADGQKILIFAHHREILEAVYKEFEDKAIFIHGGVKPDNRQAIVEQFQNLEEIRVAVLSYKAAGVGLTLTKASAVDFLEMVWVPDDLSQAEDRAHRHGQVNSVLVRHIVLEGSLDARMARRCVEKQELSEKVLDL